MREKLTRREFLKIASLFSGAAGLGRFLPEDERNTTLGIGRVAGGYSVARQEPDFRAPHNLIYDRDQLITLLEEVHVEHSFYSSRWYRTFDGYIHGAYIQPVEMHSNIPAPRIREGGQIGEVTVPMSQSKRLYRRNGWRNLYRLYYQSVHWVTDVIEGPTGKPWYEITDERLKIKYHVPASHIRLIPDYELTPLSPEVPLEDKRIVVSNREQTMQCYEGEKLVFATDVSTGEGGPTQNGIARITPRGKFRISWKMPVRHMGNGRITDDFLSYELVGVPWCCFFVSTGVAFHGTFWHNNYGYKMSSGCVNLRSDEAKWLYRWTMPVSPPGEWYQDGVGTEVQVIDGDTY